ncbi:uncharacterized protein [Amphiura filiformis]|uniref:uncharacterized protein n=1 Tax=Amphiura filiformis TaxID=82378 RepID=UPI003B21A64D
MGMKLGGYCYHVEANLLKDIHESSRHIMAHSRKKLVTEYKALLREKIQRINDKEKSITDYVTNVSKEALQQSRSLLEETDKKVFLKRFQDVSSELEVCMATLLMISSRLPSHSADSSSSSSSSDSDDDDENDDEDASDKHSAVASDMPSKSSQSSHHSQKSPDSKLDRDESDRGKGDGKKVGGDGDSRRPQITNSRRKDMELYQSPKARSLVGQLVHVAPRNRHVSPKRQLRRAQSFEHVFVETSDKSTRGDRHPRHSSSPARLGCKPPDYWKSSIADRRSQSTERRCQSRSSSSPPPKSPTSRRRSPTLPVLRQKFSSIGHRSPPPCSRQRGRRGSQSDSISKRSPQVARHRSPVSSRNFSPRSKKYQSADVRSPNLENKSTSNQPSKETAKSVQASTSPTSSRRQLQYRKSSLSPERRVDKSRQKSPTDHSRHQIKAPYAKRNIGAPGGKRDNPWYACSSPPRSGDLVKDHAEEKKHSDMEMALQPLVIPTDELEKLASELGSSGGKSEDSHGARSTNINQRSSTSSANSNTNKTHATSVPAREADQKVVSQISPPEIAHRAMQAASAKKPPGLQIPSSIHPKPVSHAEMTSSSAQNTQRQVTSLASGSIQVTVKDSQAGTRASPTDITTKLRGEQPARPREPPGLMPLTKLKETAQVPSAVHQQPAQVTQPNVQKVKGPREVFPAQQMPRTPVEQAPRHPGPTATQPHNILHQQQGLVKTPPVTASKILAAPPPTQLQNVLHQQQGLSRPVLHQQQGPASVPQVTSATLATPSIPPQNVHPTPSNVLQKVHVLQQQQGSARAPQTTTGHRLATPTTFRPVWKPILTHGNVVDVLVTECRNPGDFYVQPVDTPLQQLMMGINEYMKTAEPLSMANPVCGSICLAQWINVDECWYRAAIKSVAPAKEQKGDTLDLAVGVIFIDYGNETTIPVSCIKALDPRFQDLPPQAVHVSLANVKPCKGNTKWDTQAAELFRILMESVEVQKIFCAKVTVIPGRGNRITVDLTFKEPGQVIDEINIASELVQHGVAEFILPPAAAAATTRPATYSRTSRSSSDGTGSRPQTPSDGKTQPTHGQSQHQAIKIQQQQQHSQQKQSTPNSTSRSSGTGATTGNDPTQPIHQQQTSQMSHPEAPQRPQSQEQHSGSMKQESASSVSQGGSVASYRKAGEIKQPQSRDAREQKPQQQLVPVVTKAKQGMTLAQTIAAQAAETFHDDARSVCSSSTGSMQTARCTSSGASMKNARLTVAAVSNKSKFTEAGGISARSWPTERSNGKRATETVSTTSTSSTEHKLQR